KRWHTGRPRRQRQACVGTQALDPQAASRRRVGNDDDRLCAERGGCTAATVPGHRHRTYASALAGVVPHVGKASTLGLPSSTRGRSVDLGYGGMARRACAGRPGQRDSQLSSLAYGAKRAGAASTRTGTEAATARGGAAASS